MMAGEERRALAPGIASGPDPARVRHGAERSRTWLLALVGLALAPRLIALLLGTVGPGRILWLPDSLEYDLLGRNLALHGVFSQAVDAPFVPDLQRTPLFPAQVALAYLLTGGQRAAAIGLSVLANVVWGAVSAGFVARLAGGLAGRRAAVVAGVLLALDLTSIVYSALLLSEALFTLLLILALWALACYGRQPAGRLALAAGALLGLATLARPIGLFLFPALAPAILLARGRAWRLGLRDLLLGALALAAFVVPWSVRTAAVGGGEVASRQVAVNAYFHRGALIEAARSGRDPEVVRAELEANFQREAAAAGWSAEEQTAVMRERAATTIAENRLLYLRLQGQGTLRLLGSETDAIFDVTGLRAGPHRGPSPMVYQGFRLVGMAQLAGLYGLALLGVLRLARARRWQVLALLLLPAAYLLLASGPEAYARFRVPVMPEVVVLAGLGACGWSAPWDRNKEVVR